METWVNFLTHEYECGDINYTKFRGNIMNFVNVYLAA